MRPVTKANKKLGKVILVDWIGTSLRPFRIIETKVSSSTIVRSQEPKKSKRNDGLTFDNDDDFFAMLANFSENMSLCIDNDNFLCCSWERNEIIKTEDANYFWRWRWFCATLEKKRAQIQEILGAVLFLLMKTIYSLTWKTNKDFFTNLLNEFSGSISSDQSNVCTNFFSA